ncbi:MAG: hypothetical protein K5683_04295 [Prevotella sp.]|nr:hypothetical protein [Prevotella sp.]
MNRNKILTIFIGGLVMVYTLLAVLLVKDVINSKVWIAICSVIAILAIFLAYRIRKIQ